VLGAVYPNIQVTSDMEQSISATQDLVHDYSAMIEKTEVRHATRSPGHAAGIPPPAEPACVYARSHVMQMVVISARTDQRLASLLENILASYFRQRGGGGSPLPLPLPSQL
jgi:hypothetical protein